GPAPPFAPAAPASRSRAVSAMAATGSAAGSLSGRLWTLAQAPSASAITASAMPRTRRERMREELPYIRNRGCPRPVMPPARTLSARAGAVIGTACARSPARPLDRLALAGAAARGGRAARLARGRQGDDRLDLEQAARARQRRHADRGAGRRC